MSKLARTILIESMRRFHDREQVILHIIETAKPNENGIYLIHLTIDDLNLLGRKAS